MALTSGTSSSKEGGFLYHLHSLAEREVAHTLFTEFGPQQGTKPLTLRLINANHGLDFFGARSGVFSLPFEQPYHFDVIVDLLRKRFRFPDYTSRFVSLVAPLNALKTLTCKLIENRVPGSDFEISSVACYAWRLTPRWESLLTSYWRAPILDSYGVSEVPGLFAQKCLSCGYFHFSKSAFVEFLRLDSDLPAHGTPARLVATAFFPLAELMPILRYDTEDVFLYRGRCGASSDDGYEFLGRRNHLFALDPDPEQLISVGLLLDALDGFPEIQQTQDPRIKSLEIETDVGNPIFGYQVEHGKLRLEIAIRPEYLRSEDEILNFKGAVRASLSDRLSKFGSKVSPDTVLIEVSHEPVNRKTPKL